MRRYADAMEVDRGEHVTARQSYLKPRAQLTQPAGYKGPRCLASLFLPFLLSSVRENQSGGHRTPPPTQDACSNVDTSLTNTTWSCSVLLRPRPKSQRGSLTAEKANKECAPKGRGGRRRLGPMGIILTILSRRWSS